MIELLSTPIVNIVLLYSLILFRNVFRVMSVVLLSDIIFNVKPIKSKIIYIVSALLVTGVSVYGAVKSDGISINNADFFDTYLAFAFAVLMYIKPWKNIFKGLICAFGVEVFSAVRYLFLNLIKIEADKIELYDSNIIINIVTDLFIFLVFSVGYFIAKKKKKDDSLLGKINPVLFVLILASFIVFAMTMVVLGVDYTENYRNFILVLLNIPLISVTIYYALKLFVRSRNAEEKYKEILDLQIKHYEVIEQKNEELKIFRHDFPKIMRPILMNLKDGNTDEAERLLEDISITVANSKQEFQTGNAHLDTVLECAAQQAEKKNIKIILGSASVFPAEGIETRDIYTIFPNALDNAIEACEKIGGNAEIHFDSRIMENTVYIKISNPFNGTLNKDGSEIRTVKKDKENHGFGMKSIKKAASKYGEDNVSISVENNVFVLMIKLEIEEN